MQDDLPVKSMQQIEKGVEILRKGGVIAFPTDTVFGLGAGIYKEEALARIFKIKQRAQNISLPVLLSDVGQIHEVAMDLPSYGWRLIDCFWPGALTLIVFRTRVIKDIISNGGDTVAIRMPDHPVPYHLIKGCGMPLIGTSANLSGQPSVITAQAVKQQLGDSVDMIVEGGPDPKGIESTILDITGEVPVLIREGSIAKSVIEKVVGKLS